MRWRLLALVFVWGCATGQPPRPLTPLEAALARACASCRHNLQVCHDARPPSASGGGEPSECAQEFVGCLNAQSVDESQCAGVD